MDYKKFFKPEPIKVFIFIILFLLSLSIEPSDISFSSRGKSPISLLKALIFGINLQTDSYIIIFLLALVSYFISCLASYAFSEEAIEVYKRK